MTKFFKKKPKNQNIIDTYHKEIVDNLSGRGKESFWEAKILKKKQKYLIMSVVFVSFLFIYSVYRFIVAPPHYTDEETARSEKIVEKMLPKMGNMEPRLRGALKILKKHPRYYKKVINNITNLKITRSACPYACAFPGTVFINPRGVNKYARTDKIFAGVLVHETDHVEFFDSSPLRRKALYIHCNPLLNPQITLSTWIPDISHRLEHVEICAEKEEAKFLKEVDSPSPYGITETFPFMFFRIIIYIFKVIWKIIKSIFMSLF